MSMICGKNRTILSIENTESVMKKEKKEIQKCAVWTTEEILPMMSQRRQIRDRESDEYKHAQSLRIKMGRYKQAQKKRNSFGTNILFKTSMETVAEVK